MSSSIRRSSRKMNDGRDRRYRKTGTRCAGVLIPAICLVLAFSSSCRADAKSEIRRALAKSPARYAIHVNKGAFALQVYNRKLEVVAAYTVGYGENPDRKPKLYEGDMRTPEGVYEIVEILSMDAGKKTEAYRKLKDMNKIFFYAKDGHYKYGNRTADLGTDVYGPRFFLLSYPNKNDEKRYAEALRKGLVPPSKKDPDEKCGIGYGIAIHGNSDPAGVGHLITSGCVRMYNNDIVELDQYVQLGTPVVITPD